MLCTRFNGSLSFHFIGIMYCYVIVLVLERIPVTQGPADFRVVLLTHKRNSRFKYLSFHLYPRVSVWQKLTKREVIFHWGSDADCLINLNHLNTTCTPMPKQTQNNKCPASASQQTCLCSTLIPTIGRVKVAPNYQGCVVSQRR